MKALAALALFLLPVAPAAAQEASAPAGKQQFLYVLKLAPRLLVDSIWTDFDHAVVAEHFERLERLTEEGTVIQAGRTLSYDPMGLVFFEAAGPDEARRLMEEDPAVKEGVMSAELHPYRVALQRAERTADE
jgi:uncharacterized protein YciI